MDLSQTGRDARQIYGLQISLYVVFIQYMVEQVLSHVLRDELLMIFFLGGGARTKIVKYKFSKAISNL